MQHVLKVVEEWRERIEDHPLHRWLVAEDDGVAPEDKLWFSLYFTNFIMYFRELNLYHISYGEQRHTDAQRAALSAHADEDMTHSRLFMRDFKTLGWDGLLGWKPSEVFHWLFSSPVNESLRKRTTAITKLYIEAEDPAVRYAVVEAVEACGNALFRHTKQVADRYAARTGRELIYWGEYHLHRETGHAVEDDAEGEFGHLELTPEQRTGAIRRAVRAFELIDEQNSDMLRLAQETISQGGFDGRRRRFAAPPTDVEAIEGTETFDYHFWPAAPHPTQQAIAAALKRCVQQVHDSGALSFFDVDGVEEALARLRLALLFIATDTTGTPTVYRYMVPYPFPTTPEERAVNRLAQRFGQRASMLYVDWASLGLDERLQWPVSRTLEFIYLDRATETHRDLRAVITHHIDATTDPVLRYWTIVALKALTATYAEAIGRLAARAEKDISRPLPYLSLKLNPYRPELEPDPEADAVRFESIAVGDDTAARAVALIEEIYGAVQRRLDGMIESGRRGDYAGLG
ncbi:MAG: hypothetical protein ACJ74O_10440 [Frankiaceae bacterium]